MRIRIQSICELSSKMGICILLEWFTEKKRNPIPESIIALHEINTEKREAETPVYKWPVSYSSEKELDASWSCLINSLIF